MESSESYSIVSYSSPASISKERRNRPPKSDRSSKEKREKKEKKEKKAKNHSSSSREKSPEPKKKSKDDGALSDGEIKKERKLTLNLKTIREKSDQAFTRLRAKTLGSNSKEAKTFLAVSEPADFQAGIHVEKEGPKYKGLPVQWSASLDNVDETALSPPPKQRALVPEAPRGAVLKRIETIQSMRIKENVLFSFRAKAVVIKDYEAQDECELTLRKGDVITLIDSTTDDFWKGEFHGQIGLFDSSCVEKIRDIKEPTLDDELPPLPPMPLPKPPQETKEEVTLAPPSEKPSAPPSEKQNVPFVPFAVAKTSTLDMLAKLVDDIDLTQIKTAEPLAKSAEAPPPYKEPALVSSQPETRKVLDRTVSEVRMNRQVNGILESSLAEAQQQRDEAQQRVRTLQQKEQVLLQTITKLQGRANSGDFKKTVEVYERREAESAKKLRDLQLKYESEKLANDSLVRALRQRATEAEEREKEATAKLAEFESKIARLVNLVKEDQVQRKKDQILIQQLEIRANRAEDLVAAIREKASSPIDSEMSPISTSRIRTHSSSVANFGDDSD
eukprot:TRINITY_DN2298_c0_g1_i2.p1 TRINITY_DN2298_c0_g1~~TRINITY_DN2298_c0_g1_i2.p1  ORF type:complete len:559 (+),score=204.74 TRINITY_DN2298_c0_g1_i2:49-1725(+)